METAFKEYVHFQVCLFWRQNQYDQRIHPFPRSVALSPEAHFSLLCRSIPLPSESATTEWMARQMELPRLPAFQAPSHAVVLSVRADDMVLKLPGALLAWTLITVRASGKVSPKSLMQIASCLKVPSAASI